MRPLREDILPVAESFSELSDFSEGVVPLGLVVAFSVVGSVASVVGGTVGTVVGAVVGSVVGTVVDAVGCVAVGFAVDAVELIRFLQPVRSIVEMRKMVIAGFVNFIFYTSISLSCPSEVYPCFRNSFESIRIFPNIRINFVKITIAILTQRVYNIPRKISIFQNT